MSYLSQGKEPFFTLSFCSNQWGVRMSHGHHHKLYCRTRAQFLVVLLLRLFHLLATGVELQMGMADGGSSLE